MAIAGARTIDRRREVAEGLRDGRTYRDMAAEHGVSLGTIQDDVAAIRKEWRQWLGVPYAEHINGTVALLNSLVAENAAGARAGNPESATIVLRALDQRSKLFGLYDHAAESARITARRDAGVDPDMAPGGAIMVEFTIIPTGNRDLVENRGEMDEIDALEELEAANE